MNGRVQLRFRTKRKIYANPLLALTLLVLLAAGAESAAAEGYPARPIRFILPYPPGGGNDFVGRVLAMRLARRSRSFMNQRSVS